MSAVRATFSSFQPVFASLRRALPSRRISLTALLALSLVGVGFRWLWKETCSLRTHVKILDAMRQDCVAALATLDAAAARANNAWRSVRAKLNSLPSSYPELSDSALNPIRGKIHGIKSAFIDPLEHILAEDGLKRVRESLPIAPSDTLLAFIENRQTRIEELARGVEGELTRIHHSLIAQSQLEALREQARQAEEEFTTWLAEGDAWQREIKREISKEFPLEPFDDLLTGVLGERNAEEIMESIPGTPASTEPDATRIEWPYLTKARAIVESRISIQTHSIRLAAEWMFTIFQQQRDLSIRREELASDAIALTRKTKRLSSIIAAPSAQYTRKISTITADLHSLMKWITDIENELQAPLAWHGDILVEAAELGSTVETTASSIEAPFKQATTFETALTNIKKKLDSIRMRIKEIETAAVPFAGRF